MKRILIFALICFSMPGPVPAEEYADTLYKQGTSVFASDPAKALELFQQAGEGGNISAMVGAGHCYETGTGTKRDYAKAINWYEKAVQKNSLKACEGLARIYASCLDPEFHDGKKAVKYASAFARKQSRNAEAHTLLAHAYLRNMQPELAVESGTKAARYAGSIEESRKLEALPERYKDGRPVPAEATEVWMMQAAEREIPWAMGKMVPVYADKRGDLYNPQLAILIGEKAIAAGQRQLYQVIGDLYYDVEECMDLKKAADCYRGALSYKNYAKGTIPFRLENCHYMGRDAISCLQIAEKKRTGYKKSERYIMRYEEESEYVSTGYGTGYSRTIRVPVYGTRWVEVPPEPELASFLYELAAKKGHEGARKMLELNLVSRRTPLHDYRRELHQWSMGSAEKARSAIERYEVLYELQKQSSDALGIARIYLLNPNMRDYAKGNVWMKKCLEGNYTPAHECLAKFYSTGPDPEVWDGAKAVQHARLCLKANPDSHNASQVMACAFARNGQFSQAQLSMAKAIGKLKTMKSQSKTIDQYEKQLECFKQGKPWPEGGK